MSNFIYRSDEFTRAMNEHFDIEDRDTRKILLAVNETDQNQVLSALTSRLYDNIINKVDEIDFGDIPATKGDITRLPNYNKLVDCIGILQNILVQYKQETKPIDLISNALENIKVRRPLFERGYKFNVELPMIVYNTVSLAIISSLSLMISTSIEFIKTPSQDNFDIVLDKVALTKTKESLLFTNLQKFNDSCKKGDIDNALEAVIKNNMKNLTGLEIGFVAGGIAIAGILFNIVPILRELIFFFYYSRTRVSDYFDVQADLLQMNAHNIEINKLGTDADRKKIISKQLKIVEIFRKLSNTLAVSCKSCEISATKELINNDKKYKTSDIMDSVPDSASSALF